MRPLPIAKPKAGHVAQENCRRNLSQLAAVAAGGAGPIKIGFRDEVRVG